MGATGNQAGPAATLEQRAMAGPGADLVLEGGGVKGIGLVGAVLTLDDAGYVFPRVGGTSAGAIVAALIAAYQVRGIPLTRLKADMLDLDYTQFMQKSWAEKHLGMVGEAGALLEHQGLYASSYVEQWLTAKLEPLGIRTFADLKITSDDGTSLEPYQRYRLVTHTSDLSRGALVRLPWDLPYYLLDSQDRGDAAKQVAAIDGYRVVDAVRASMSIPFFFRPFEQPTAYGTCTWVDGGVLQNFPVTVFDRTDGGPNRWPTFGIKLSARPRQNLPDVAVHGNIREIVSIAHTALGEWNRYPLADEGVGVRTVYVDTMNVSSTDFGLTPELRDQLFANGQTAAVKFLAAWDRVHPRPAPAASVAPTVIVAPEVVITREVLVTNGGAVVADGAGVMAEGAGVMADGAAVVADGAPGGTAAGAASGAAAGAAVAEGVPAGGAAAEVGP